MKVKRVFVFFPIFFSGFLFTGCAGLTHHKDEAALSQVKRVAIVGFTVQEPAPATIGLNLNSGHVHGAAGGSLITQYSTDTDQMYSDLVKKFGRNTSWVVVSPSKMKQNPGYQKAYDDTMKGFHNRMPPGEGMNVYGVNGVMDNQSCRLLGADGRSALMKALKVDAIVTAQVDVLLSGTSIMGIGSRYPQSRLTFQVFTPNKDSADWFEGNLLGKESPTSVGSTAFFDVDTLNRLALASAKTAFDEIGKQTD